MASIRECASKVIDTAREGMNWFAIWKTGRSWHVMEITTEDCDYEAATLELACPEDAQEIERILAEDPDAVFLDSYYCNLGDPETMTVSSLAKAIRWQYEVGSQSLSNWTFKCETEPEESESEIKTSEPNNTEAERSGQEGSKASLTEEENKFFKETVARVKRCVNVSVPIKVMDHDQLEGKHRKALGICWAKDDGAGNFVPYQITIDDFFVHECYVGLDDPSMKLEPESLEEVIAHEIAHLRYWRHGKKHTELTRHICRLIENGKPLSDSREPTRAISVQRWSTAASP